MSRLAELTRAYFEAKDAASDYIDGRNRTPDITKLYALKEAEQALRDALRTADAEPGGDATCANCKGLLGDLAEGRDPEELCDTCYDDAIASLRASEAEPGGDVEVNIRIAIWNAGMKGGMGQDAAQAFVVRAMDEPLMQRALAAINATQPTDAEVREVVERNDALAKAFFLLDTFAGEGLEHTYGNGQELSACDVVAELTSAFGVELEENGWWRILSERLTTARAMSDPQRLGQEGEALDPEVLAQASNEELWSEDAQTAHMAASPLKVESARAISLARAAAVAKRYAAIRALKVGGEG